MMMTVRLAWSLSTPRQRSYSVNRGGDRAKDVNIGAKGMCAGVRLLINNEYLASLV